MLECNKNYAILAFNCMLYNSEKTISVLEIYIKNKNKDKIAEKNM